MTWRASVAGVLGLVVLAACSGPWTPGPDAASATMLKVAFKQGGSYRYHYHVTLQGVTSIGQRPDQPIKLDSSADVTWRVTSVNAAGDTTIDVTLDNLKTTVTGSVLPGSSTTTTTTTTGSQHGTITVAPSGEIVAGGSSLGAAAALSPFPGTSPPGADQFLAVLPDHSVRPGDTWTGSVTLPSPAGQPGINFTTDNHFLRYDNLKTGRAAVVETRATLPLDTTIDLGQLPASAAGTPSAPPVPVFPQLAVKIRTQGTLSFDSTTWFDTRTDVVEKTRSVDDSDITTTITGPPSGPLPQTFPGSVHSRGTQTLQLDLLS